MTEKTLLLLSSIFLILFSVCSLYVRYLFGLSVAIPLFLITESGEKLVFLCQIVELSTNHYHIAHASWLP